MVSRSFRVHILKSLLYVQRSIRFIKGWVGLMSHFVLRVSVKKLNFDACAFIITTLCFMIYSGR